MFGVWELWLILLNDHFHADERCNINSSCKNCGLSNSNNQYSHRTGSGPCVSIIDLLRASRAVITLNGYWIVSSSSGLPSPSVGSTNLFVVDIADNIDPLITVTLLKDFLLNKYLSFSLGNFWYKLEYNVFVPVLFSTPELRKKKTI